MCGLVTGAARPWREAKLLFISGNPREVTWTVSRLLRSRVRCAVRKERWNSSYGVWLQDKADFSKALRIWRLPGKPQASQTKTRVL
jgi:hypothetical protein